MSSCDGNNLLGTINALVKRFLPSYEDITLMGNNGDAVSGSTTTKNKGGRPRKYPGEGRRPNLSLRVRGGLYELLKDAADASERTISEEMERRLEASFKEKELIEAVQSLTRRNTIELWNELKVSSAGGDLNYMIGQQFASILSGWQVYLDNKGNTEAWTRDRTKKLVEDRGASDILPALIERFPFGSQETAAILEVQRKEDSDRTAALHEAMQRKQKQAANGNSN